MKETPHTLANAPRAHMKNLQTPLMPPCLPPGSLVKPPILCSVLGLAIALGSSRAPPSAPTSTIEVAAAAALVAAVAVAVAAAAAAAAGFVDAVLHDGKQSKFATAWTILQKCCCFGVWHSLWGHEGHAGSMYPYIYIYLSRVEIAPCELAIPLALKKAIINQKNSTEP